VGGPTLVALHAEFETDSSRASRRFQQILQPAFCSGSARLRLAESSIRAAVESNTCGSSDETVPSCVKHLLPDEPDEICRPDMKRWWRW